MLNNSSPYNGIIRKVIVGFGTLFSNIFIDRREGDSVTGPTVQRLQVPISYAPKEKYLVRLEQDSTLENHTYTSLPRISFEITGYQYDTERQIGKMNQIVCKTEDGASVTYAPVPYNIAISLYILTKNQEDALQILEQILPTFRPEYTLSINAISDMNIIQNIPIVLNNVSIDDQYDGDFQTRRFVIHTLDFTIKTGIFGEISRPGLIYHIDLNLSTNPDMSSPFIKYHADGDPETKIITDYWLENF